MSQENIREIQRILHPLKAPILEKYISTILDEKNGALRNIQLMANREASFKVHHSYAEQQELWRHIQRFCMEGGMTNSPIREDT